MHCHLRDFVGMNMQIWKVFLLLDIGRGLVCVGRAKGGGSVGLESVV